MTWRLTLAALAGTALPELPPVTSTRRHRLGEENTQMDEWRALSLSDIARLAGISRPAAYQRRQRCRATGDWSTLLAPAMRSAQRGQRRKEAGYGREQGSTLSSAATINKGGRAPRRKTTV